MRTILCVSVLLFVTVYGAQSVPTYCNDIDSSLPRKLTWITSTSSTGASLGRDIGKKTDVSNISYIYESMGLQELFDKYTTDTSFKTDVDKYTLYHKKAFPNVYAELEAYAQELGMPLYKLNIAQFQVEIGLGVLDVGKVVTKRTSNRNIREHCSDVLVLSLIHI